VTTAGFDCVGGQCLKAGDPGVPCTVKENCVSGYCVDGVCCDTECAGVCKACTAALKGYGKDGACADVKLGTDPEDDCAEDPPASCKNTGVCNGSGGCERYGSTTVCSPDSCKGGVVSSLTCDGAGMCGPSSADKSCGLFACKDALSCATSCTTDAGCAPEGYCSSGTCVADGAPGTACVSAGQCASGFCVDGVCCMSACDGACVACEGSLKETGPSGLCGAVKEGSLDAACPVGGACKADGACGKSGTCRPFAAAGVACGATSCTDATTSAGQLCNGLGACEFSPGTACGAYACSPVTKACLTQCNAATDCAAGSYCAQKACFAKVITGKECTATDQCQSGHCVDGVCCESACEGACLNCNGNSNQSGQSGKCDKAVVGTDPRSACNKDGEPCGATGLCGDDGECQLVAKPATPCGTTSCASGSLVTPICDSFGKCAAKTIACAPFACDEAGGVCLKGCSTDAQCAAGLVCKGGTCTQLPNGAACEQSPQCTSGTCVDGVCCESACDGACQFCAVEGSKGVCTTLLSGTPLKPGTSCGDDPVCGGQCKGDPTDCTFPAQGVACAAAACASADVVTLPQLCDGAGKCEAAKTESCAPFVCDAAAKACKTKCTNDKDCSTGAVCGANGQCTLGEATCADKNTAKAPDGTLKKCDPYTCLNGQCRDVCASDLDCVGSFRCDAQVCVPKGGAGGSAGQGGSAMTGGRGGASAGGSAAGQGAGGGGAGGAGGAGAPANDGAISADDSGCGCRTAGTTPPSGGLSLVGLGLALALGTRRRR
jgi:MYXO-CTERM domain-containing protein